MTAVHGIEPALAGARSPVSAQQSTQPATERQQRATGAQQIDTQMRARARVGDIGQALAASLSTRVRASVAESRVLAYAAENSPVPGFLRAVATQLAGVTTPEAGAAIIGDARAAVAAAATEVQPLARADGVPAQAALQALTEQLQAGLDRLQHTPVAQVGTDVASQSEASVSLRVSAKLSLNIRTADGDVVRLRVRASHASGAESQTLQTQNGSMTRAEGYVSSDTRVRVDVRGHLDADELSAVHDVIAQVDAAARGVLSGDLDSAIETLAAFEADSDELARVSLSLRVRERLRLAATARQYVTAVPVASPGPSTAPGANVETASAAPPAPAPGAARIAPAPSSDTARSAPSPAAAPAPVPAVPATVEASAAATGGSAAVADTAERTLSGLATVLHQFISSTHVRATAGERGLRLQFDQDFIGGLLQSLILVREQSQPLAGAPAAQAAQDG